MKFHLARSEGRNLFTGYGEGYVSVNDRRYENSLVVAPAHEVTVWSAESFDALTPAHFEALLELKPEIVILGTGERLRFPRPEVTRSLAAARVGFEAMDTKAACRTYNILMAEGRAVVAAILLGA
jgi:uncharacterized protein